MQPIQCPLPGLEQALLPLDQPGRPAALSGDTPFPRLEAILSLALEQRCLNAAREWLLSARDQDTRRALSLLRRCMVSRLGLLHSLLPTGQALEEQALDRALLSLELTAALAQPMDRGPVREALDFTLPECLDALYRTANLLLLRGFPPATALIGHYAEIMPGRPMAACHRHPFDGVAPCRENVSLWESMALTLLCALEEDNRRFAQCALPAVQDELTRGFLEELALLCEQRCVLYASLLPPPDSAHSLPLARYTACYLFHAWRPEEESHALAQLEKLRRLAGLDAPPPYPPPLQWGMHKGAVRDALAALGVTALRDGYAPVGELPRGADFFRYQKRLFPVGPAPSSQVIQAVIARFGADGRFEIAPHPVEALLDRGRDHSELGR